MSNSATNCNQKQPDKQFRLVSLARRCETAPATPAAQPVLTAQEQGLSLLSGHFECATPSHIITLVHAVRQPLLAAAPRESFSFMREADQTAAALESPLPGDEEVWVSAAKIVCKATWTDCVDDLSKDAPRHVSFGEQVFEISETDWRDNIQVFHHLRDTRAHNIEYQLSAMTGFRDYFPADEPASNFVLESKPLPPMTVCSSVRPPAPVLSYCVPAFAWLEDDNSAGKGWVRQRVPAIRCYLERPFRVSGDNEQLAVVLLPDGQTDDPQTNDPKSPAKYVSRIGQDPLWTSDHSPALANALSAKALSRCEVHHDLLLAENRASVDIAAFKTEYAPDRKLWFCDIPFCLAGQYTPFVRLAMVRYQPDALKPKDDNNVEARISPVVMADFCQIAPNRFASLQRTGKVVTLTISGDAYATRAGGTLVDPKTAGTKDARPVPVSFDNPFTVELQHRWHKLPWDFDPGWRPTSFKHFDTKMDCKNGIVTWTLTCELPHSPAMFKYRLLLEENEILYGDSDAARSANTQDWHIDMFQTGSVKAVQRVTYIDFFEL